MKRVILMLISILVMQFISNISISQPNGEIKGKVVDRLTKQPVADAIVSIEKTGIKAGTDLNGEFRFTGLESGTFTIKISTIGYVPILINDVVVMRGREAEVYAELDIIQTDEIIVEAERFVKPSDIVSSFKNLRYEEIRRAPGGFEDIGRVVQTLPGVSFVNDGRNDLIVRGGSPAENLFLLDNSPIPNINHFGSQGATGGPTSLVNLDLVREINFITGGFSARYGDKLSSVLEIKLREGNRERFAADINLSATGLGAVFEGPIGGNKKGSFILSARRSYLDFIFNAAGFGFIPEYTDFQLKANYDISKSNAITFNFIGNLDKVRFNNDTEEKKQDNEDILKNNQSGYSNSIELRTLTSSKSYLLTTLSRSFTKFDFSGRDANFVETFKNNSEEGETQLKSEFFVLPVKSTQISFGAGISIIDFKNDIAKTADTLFFADPNPIIIPAVNLNTDNNAIKGFGYIQVTQSPATWLRLNAGLRFDYFNFITNKSYVSPRVSANISLLKNLNLNLNYGIFYQSPSYIWLVSNPENKALNNIRADHYIAGLEYLFSSDTRATVEVYYKDYKNYPVSQARPYFILANNGGDFQKPENFGLEPLVSEGTGFARGVEFFFQKALTEKLYGTVNLSIFEAKYKSLDGIERPSDYDNKFLFTMTGGYLFGNGWEFASKFRFYGGRPYTPINPTTGIQQVSQYNSERLPNYYSLDVRLDKRWDFSKWSLITYIDIQNITGRKNITNYKWNKYKQEIEANESLGVFPTIGINAMF